MRAIGHWDAPVFRHRNYANAFMMRSPNSLGDELRIIATTVGGWDHVSVSTELRCPTWDEMEHVKRAFFEAHETAMQLHVPPAEHLNFHPFCLHLWRPQLIPIPRPPNSFVGAPS